ncbi:LexA family protein [Streptomyces avermitilis]
MEHGEAPTVREIARTVGLSSTSTAGLPSSRGVLRDPAPGCVGCGCG